MLNSSDNSSKYENNSLKEIKSIKKKAKSLKKKDISKPSNKTKHLSKHDKKEIKGEFSEESGDSNEEEKIPINSNNNSIKQRSANKILYSNDGDLWNSNSSTKFNANSKYQL